LPKRRKALKKKTRVSPHGFSITMNMADPQWGKKKRSPSKKGPKVAQGGLSDRPLRKEGVNAGRIGAAPRGKALERKNTPRWCTNLP